MEVKLLSGALGAEVSGIDLTDSSDENFNKINFFPGFVNQDNVSISSLITNTSGDFKINIDRTQVIDEESIIVWINDADFMRLYDWLFSIQDRVSLDKTSLTKSSGGRVSAQLNLSKI